MPHNHISRSHPHQQMKQAECRREEKTAGRRKVDAKQRVQKTPTFTPHHSCADTPTPPFLAQRREAMQKSTILTTTTTTTTRLHVCREGVRVANVCDIAHDRKFCQTEARKLKGGHKSISVLTLRIPRLAHTDALATHHKAASRCTQTQHAHVRWRERHRGWAEVRVERCTKSEKATRERTRKHVLWLRVASFETQDAHILTSDANRL